MSEFTQSNSSAFQNIIPVPPVPTSPKASRKYFKLHIDNRHYDTYTIIDTASGDEINMTDPIYSHIQPSRQKLFHDDIIEYDTRNREAIKVHASPTRNASAIPGVLICQTTKIYGREKNKFYYKCIPDDPHLPHFIVPHSIGSGSFNKNYKNKYITFRYKHWDKKHPNGILIQSFGEVSSLQNYCEYQLRCKHIYHSLTPFSTKTHDTLKAMPFEDIIDHIHEEKQSMYQFETRCIGNGWDIYTIDSETTKDYDDAISFKKVSVPYDERGSNVNWLLSIYITNVTIIMEFLQLWNAMSDRVSSMYFPHETHHMLPKILSESMCTLKEGKRRFALALDIRVSEFGTIIDTSFHNVFISVNKNHIYEDLLLIGSMEYRTLFEVVKRMNLHNPYLKNLETSYDVVAYTMILMNYYCAHSFKKYRNGIFRTNTTNTKSNSSDTDTDINTIEYKECQDFMKIWRSSAGTYVYDERTHDGDNDNDNDNDNNNEHDHNTFHIGGHDMLGLDAYVHMTSPIRRLVDLINLTHLQENEFGLELSPNFRRFAEKWIGNIDKINSQMKTIRHLQTQCTLLDLCMNKKDIDTYNYSAYIIEKEIVAHPTTTHDNSDIHTHTHTQINTYSSHQHLTVSNEEIHDEKSGIVYDESNIVEEMVYQYTVYIPFLKLVAHVHSNLEKNIYQHAMCRIYMFEDQFKYKQKVRVHITK